MTATLEARALWHLELLGHVMANVPGLRSHMRGYRPECSKAEREHTPTRLAAWLVEIARRTRVLQEVAA